MVAIYPIVEGHGEVQAVPILLRRIATELYDRHDIRVLTPHRIPRGRIVSEKSDDLLKAVQLGERKITHSGQHGAVLVLLDADNDCPAELGPQILKRTQHSSIVTTVVVANKEYEAWFLAAAGSLTKSKNIRDRASAPANPEAIRDAKHYLQHRLFVKNRYYRETVDQPSLTASFDLAAARTTKSFDKLCREIGKLLADR